MDVSRHFALDRIERATYIASTIGIGEPIFEQVILDENKRIDTYQQVTDTGVIIILAKDRSIITMYIASKHQVFKIFGDKKVPMRLVNKVTNNHKKGYYKNCPKES